MQIRFSETRLFWRVMTCYVVAKYKADVYNATDKEIKKLKKWLKFQGIGYTCDSFSYYSARNMEEAENIKPKITIHIRNEEDLMSIKLAWC